MPTLIITRPREWINKFRRYKIYVDGKPLGSIRNDEIIQLETTEGRHVITAKIDWCSSNEHSVTLSEGETYHLKISAFKEAAWLMPVSMFVGFGALLAMNFLHNEYLLLVIVLPLLPLLYFLTIGRKNYLFVRKDVL